MTDTNNTSLRNAGVMLLSAASSVLLAALWHRFGWARPYSTDGYEFTQYLTSCVSWWFILVYLSSGWGLGWITRTAWPVALGMISPLPIAFCVEVAKDPTSHNLIPFEVVLFWVPALALAFAGAYTGLRLRAGAQGPVA